MGTKWVFCATDFSDLGRTATVNVTLWRFEKQNKIRRLQRGLYKSNTNSPNSGVRSKSDPENVIAAIGRQTDALIRFAEKLPKTDIERNVKFIYFTTGRSQIIELDDYTIELKHVSANRFHNLFSDSRIGTKKILGTSARAY